MRILEHIVNENEQGQTLRALVPKVFRLSSHAFRRLKVQNGIRVNGEARHVSCQVNAGDSVTVHLLSESISPEPDAEPGHAQQTVQHSGLILYLDEDLLIADKPAPLPTLPGRYTGITLRELLAEALSLDPDAAYHPVNRLDKGTSGLLCIARHDHAQHLLTQSLHTGAFIREYLAVTEGIPSPPASVIRLPIARAGSGARRVISPEGKPSVTRYEVLYAEAESARALVRLNLETGRTHQIRVHLAAIGCPIVGDYLYGQEHPDLRDRFALHSAHLRCRQPVTGAVIDLTAPFPDALAALFHSPDAARAAVRF